MSRLLRSFLSVFITCLFGAVFFTHPVAAATCDISTNTTIDAAYVETNSCDAITLTGTPTITWSGTIDTGRAVVVSVDSGTTIFSGALTLGNVGSSVTVASGATVTHAAEDKNGVQITAPTVTVTGSVNVTSKGCGANKGINGTNDCAAGFAGAPGNSYSGGAYGGSGGSGYYTGVNTGTYGSSTNPTLLGSGGGASIGGGRVGLIVSGTLTVSGSVVANGGAGGGSGGSIYINAATFNGSGTVTANGGAVSGGCNGRGGGGGGRIAVYYGAAAFSVASASSIAVSAGTGGCSDATNGTTFILDRQVDDGAGTLTFNGGGLFAAGVDYVRDTINIVSGAYLTCDTALTSLTVSSTNALAWPSSSWVCAPTAATSLSIGSNSSISLTSLTATFAGTMGAVKVEGASLAMSGVSWSLSGASSLALNVASFSNNVASTLTMSKAGSYTAFNTTGALALTNFTYTGGTAGTASGETGGHLIFPRSIDLTLTNGKILASVSSTFASVSIDSTSQISANGKGCSGAFGPNSSNVCTSATAGYGASYGGAGHGGAGGTGYYSTGGASYGSSTYPVLFGSGTTNGGGTGGGRIWLTVTGSLTNNGLITANGGAVGGSGGSIYLNAATFAGAGNVSSTGAAGDGNNGCGAGGRIAMIASSFTFSGTSSTAAGATGCTGAAGVGTIYRLVSNRTPSIPSSLGPTALVSGSTTGTSTPTFSFTLSDPDATDTVKYQIQIDDSADFGSPVADYTSALATQGSQMFLVGQAAGTGAYTVGSSGQVLTSGAYYWRVKAIDASAAASSYSAANSGSIAFIVDTAARSVQFSTSTGSGLESVSSGSAELSLDQTHFENVTVSYAITSGSADGSGVDYTLASGTATITAGQTMTTIPFTIVDDSIDEPDETFTVTLSAPVSANLGATTTFTYTVTDNDAAAIAFSGTSALTATEGGAGDSFTVVLGSAPTSTISIGFTTSTYGVTLSTSTVAFTDANWSTPVTVTVSATSDAIYEGSHTATVTPSISGTGYGYANLSLSVFTAAVTDNDTAGVTLSPTTLSIAEGDLIADTYTAVLTSQPTSTVRISFATSTNGVTLDAAYVEFTSSNWSAPQTVSLLATDDDVAEGLHEASVLSSASVASGFALGYMTGNLSITPVVVSIADNDSPGVFVSAATASVKEGSDVDTYTVVLTTAPTSTVSVALALSNDQVTLSASTLVFTTGNWNVPQTVTVTAVNDGTFETQTTAVIAHAAASEGVGYVPGLAIGSVTVTVNDNDNPGGGGVGAGIGVGIAIPLPMPPVAGTPNVPGPAPRDPDTSSSAPAAQVFGDGAPVPAALVRAISRDADTYQVRLSDADRDRLAAFVMSGVSKETAALGSGERAALIRDVFETVGRAVSDTDLAKLADRQIPAARNLPKEQKLQPRALSTFQTIYGRKPNFKNTEENLAWNTLMYRIRFPRDLGTEKDGIKEFRSLFGKDPKDPFQWATVRVLGYVKK